MAPSGAASLSSTSAEWDIADVDQPGIVAGVYRGEKPPMIAEIVGDAIGMPVLANADLSFKATVVSHGWPTGRLRACWRGRLRPVMCRRRRSRRRSPTRLLGRWRAPTRAATDLQPVVVTPRHMRTTVGDLAAEAMLRNKGRAKADRLPTKGQGCDRCGLDRRRRTRLADGRWVVDAITSADLCVYPTGADARQLTLAAERAARWWRPYGCSVSGRTVARVGAVDRYRGCAQVALQTRRGWSRTRSRSMTLPARSELVPVRTAWFVAY